MLYAFYYMAHFNGFFILWTKISYGGPKRTFIFLLCAYLKAKKFQYIGSTDAATKLLMINLIKCLLMFRKYHDSFNLNIQKNLMLHV